MDINANVVDICLSDYLQRSYDGPGETLCYASLGDDIEGTVDQLVESMDHDCGIPEQVTDDEIRQAFRDALQGVDLRYIDGDGNPCDEVPDERDDIEPYLYVTLTWDARTVELNLVVDVEVYQNGYSPAELRQALEAVAAKAVADAFASYEVHVKSWGATALVGKSTYIK